MERNLGECKLQQIHYKNTFGKLNLGKFNIVNIEQSVLAEETLWSFTKSANVSFSRVSL